MSVIALGLNHTTAPLDLRGRVAFAPEQLAVALHGFRERVRSAQQPEAALLSTCNRTELYFAAEPGRAGDLVHPAIDWLAAQGSLSGERMRDHTYVLADRGTWLNFKNRADLAILVEGDTKLFNQYGVMVVNPAKHPHVKSQDAQKFVDWVVSPAGQRAIAGYKIGGEQLFFPNATQ